MIRIAAVLLLATACGGATSTAPAGDRKPGRGDDAFALFVDDYFAAESRYSPSTAVGAGFHDFDAQIEDRSRARIEQRIAELHGLLDRLAAIDRATLGFDAAIDAQALEA